MRKRSEKFVPVEIAARPLKLQERLAHVKYFWQSHEQLQRTISDLLGPNSYENSAD